MILYDSDRPAPNTSTVRQFILERSGLNFDMEIVDLTNLANREEYYITQVNSRGEVPALRLDSDEVITEITAICAYLDEVAENGVSLFGDTAEERAITNMWVRRMYLEICYPMVTWWRGTDRAKEFYKGHRLPATQAQDWMKAQTERGIERLNQDLIGKEFIAGNKLTMADILLNGFMITMSKSVPWVDRPDLENFTKWRAMMTNRPTSKQMLEPLIIT